MDGHPRRGAGSRARRATLADVAREAGVSTAAASYGLNGLPGVSDESCARILAAAETLGFRPNSLARSLRKGKSQVLGLLLADIANPYYSEMASGAIAAATRRNHQVFLMHTGLNEELHAGAVAALLQHQCAGLLFTSAVEAGRPTFEELFDLAVPYVQVVRRLASLPADFVGIDDRSAAWEIADHVLQRGRTRPVILNGPAVSSASQERLAGYRAALETRSVTLAHPELVDGELSSESGRNRASMVLEAGEALPDVLICGNDMIALGALGAVTEHGLRTPEDIAIVGFDNMTFASAPLLGLTTVEVPRQAMGQAATELLFERMIDPLLPPRSVILPHRLMVRRTCGSHTSPDLRPGKGRVVSSRTHALADDG